MIINTHILVGSIFYQSKSKNELLEMVQALTELKVLGEPTLAALESENEATLTAEFGRLFEGLGDMPAPPWGSVYLDKERVIFGESTIAYRQFLRSNEIELNSGLREPEDHFGLMFLAHAYLLNENKIDSANELMEEHLLPWAYSYLNNLINQTEVNFYKLLSDDIVNWLKNISSEYNLSTKVKQVYID